MISVAACAGDASAVTASAANCKNLKANFTGDFPALPRWRNLPAKPSINPSGGGFNPPGTTAAHKTIQDCLGIMRITRRISPADPAADSQASVNSAKNA
jgi:hypothetical protein